MGQSVIEINGTRYDASTGRVVVDDPTPPKELARSGGHNIDGIVSTTSTPTPQNMVPKPKVRHIPTSRLVRDINTVHSPKTIRSKTLMRSVVKKPHNSQLAHTPTPAATNLMHSPSYQSANSHDARLKQAVTIPTHTRVSRFAHPSQQQQKLQPKVVPHLPLSTGIEHKPQQAKTAHTPQTKTSATDFVDTQLSKHVEAPAPSKKKRLHKRALGAMKSNKLRSAATASLACLLIGGFIVYQNLPTISLALANREAGISAKLPKGIPSNFAINTIAGTQGGNVVLNYESRVDDRQFTLTQVKADTTVQSLEDTVARVSENQYQTYQAGGITLFLSPGDRVDWIDGDMRYNINGTTGFSPDQIAQIATSL